jgi:lipopolysaccharide export system permease protein
VELEGFRYLLLRVPFMMSQLLPVSVLAGVMFTFAMLHRSEEVTALQAVGISRSQLALPVFAVATLLTVFNFVLSERIAPITNRWSRQLLESELSRNPHQQRSDKIWVRTRHGFLMADRFDKASHELEDITVFELGPYPTLHVIQQVQHARWDGREWVLSGVSDLQFERGDRIEGGSEAGALETSPADLAALESSNPDELSLAELDRFIAELRRNHLAPAAYLVVRSLKFALPFSCLVMAALGFAGSLEPTPRRSALGAKIGFAVASGIGYWIVLGFTVSLGKSDLLPPWPAAWAPNLLFASLALAIFLLGEEKQAVRSSG